jgi:hypothetical protein
MRITNTTSIGRPDILGFSLDGITLSHGRRPGDRSPSRYLIGCEARSAKLVGRTDWADLAWPVRRLTFGVGQTPRSHVRP